MPDPSRTHLVLIPSYNPGPVVRATVLGALEQWDPVWVVMDGSTDESVAILDELDREHAGLRVLKLPVNQGKGAAVLHGLHAAADAGFTHVLTMDSDGQHPAAFIPRYMAAAPRGQGTMVLGKPVFGPEAPRERVQGRRWCNFWTDLETLWFGLGDSLFGMRLYPVGPTLAIMDRIRGARRFDFEPEIAVRLCWSGVRPVMLPTPVRYLSREEGGVSHFHYWRDTTRIILMHARLLFLCTPIHAPLMLLRRWLRPAPPVEVPEAMMSNRHP